MHICATYLLKLGMDPRKEKEGVVILRHDLCNSPPNVWNGSENRKRESGYSLSFWQDLCNSLAKVG